MTQSSTGNDQSLDPEAEATLERFLRQSAFWQSGGIVTDLDGTSVHEHQGRIRITPTVEIALKRLAEQGRPLFLNTLRFPMSVIRTFGRDWCALSNAPIPAVTLNGSLLGRVVETAKGDLEFEELECRPLHQKHIEDALGPVEQLVQDGVREVLVFYYPREWRLGEVIWTPVAENVMRVKDKYKSASAVSAVEPAKLREQLLGEDICMMLVLFDVPQDKRMAYQRSQESQFFTADGVDKLTGTQLMARHLGVQLDSSLGAGDTAMDTFLNVVGCAVVVGAPQLTFRGVNQTIHVQDSLTLGRLLWRLGELRSDA